MKHFSDYWKEFPKRISSLEERLGVEKGSFENSFDGFNNFTYQAERVISEAISVGNVRNINGKIQSMMPSDIKSFNNMK